MAELDSSNRNNINQGTKVRSRKANIKVDLTAMVDLAFKTHGNGYCKAR
jgi:hypothetical protein